MLENFECRVFGPRKGRFAGREPAHAQAVVNHDEAGRPALRGQKLCQRVIGQGRPGNREKQGRNRQHADRQKQPLLELNPFAVLANREVQVLHGAQSMRMNRLRFSKWMMTGTEASARPPSKSGERKLIRNLGMKDEG